MPSICLASLLSYALNIGAVALSASSPELTVHTRNVLGSSSDDPVGVLARAFSNFRNQKRVSKLQDSTQLEKSWNDATLFSVGIEAEGENVSGDVSVEVTCVTCYLKGNAFASLTIDGDFNALQAVQNLTEQVADQIENITDTTWDWAKNATGGIFDNLADGLDSSDFDLPPLDLDFNIQYPELPECHLQFQFDGLELYLMLNTALSGGADYKLPLYSSNTLGGLSLDSETFVGVIFSVDLILSISAEMDFTSGIHIKIEDGVAIDLSLFSNDISSITYNGGQFEFLPVTVLSASGELKAVLRLGIYAGIAVDDSDFFDLPGANVTAGLQVGVYADIATFSTNFMADPGAEGDDECALQMQQSYEFGLGAAAGASVGIGKFTWGPSPETQTPIFYTTIVDVCATQGTSTTTTTPTVTASLTARADEELETTTLTTEVTYTGMVCESPSLTNCPASLQKTTKVVSTKTLVTAVPSGSTAAFPTSTDSVVASPVPFGTNVRSVVATTGSPASYVPPKETDDSDGSGKPSESREAEPLGKTGRVDNRVIIGVSVGVGVPVIAAIVAALIFCSKRRRYTAAPREEPVYTGSPQPYPAGGFGSGEPKVSVVTSVRRD